MSCQRLLWVYLNLVVKKFEVSVTYDLMGKNAITHSITGLILYLKKLKITE